MHEAKVTPRPRFRRSATTDRRLFGAFVEHLGRCVYGGIYEPGHPTADEAGLPRRRAGAGPRARRRRSCAIPAATSSPATTGRTASARSTSGRGGSTSPGCRPSRTPSAPTSSSTGAGSPSIEPMLAVNLGTRGPDAARRLVEYCNHPVGHRVLRPPPRARLGEAARRQVLVPRQRDGRRRGRWAAKTATEYGRVATEAAKMMRWSTRPSSSPPVGSSGRTMPTFGEWEREVLEHTFDHVEFISLHTYLNDYAGDTAALSREPRPDGRLHRGGRGDRRRGCRRDARSDKRIMLSFDEWNVWYRTRRGGRPRARRAGRSRRTSSRKSIR